jgi:streptogramin lyase
MVIMGSRRHVGRAARHWRRHKPFFSLPHSSWHERRRLLGIEPLEDRSLLSAIAVSTLPATGISATGATLNGSVNPQGATATVRFQYSSDPTLAPTVQTTIGSGFSGPDGVAVDAAGDVFVADLGNKAVKEVLPNGTIKTISSGFTPTGVAVDAAGDVFITPNNAVEEILPNGTIKTIGSGFDGPTGVAVDAAGDVFVADTLHQAVKEVLPNGTIKTIGSGFMQPEGVAVDAAGDVFVSDVGNNSVKEVLPNGTIKTIGSGFVQPEGVAVDAAGDVFVGDVGNNAVKEVLPNGTIKTIATVGSPFGVAVDAAGDVFVTDYDNNRIVEFSPATVAATPSVLSSSSATAVSGALTGLMPGTTYFYRVVAASSGETVVGQTVEFTTSRSPHQQYVVAVYEDVLGRAPDSGGLAYWTNLLDTGTAISSVAESISHSAEYYANFVIKPAYHTLLGRTADDAGVAYWTQRMQNGLTDQELEAGFVASDEFFTNAGGTNIAWIDSIYKLLLGRSADTSGETYWNGQLTAGATRLEVAERIAGSAENDTQLINADYLHYLGRAADPGGLSYWLQQFADGATNEDVVSGFTGSAEYYKEHTS